MLNQPLISYIAPQIHIRTYLVSQVGEKEKHGETKQFFLPY
jgi:hypothetical protein